MTDPIAIYRAIQGQAKSEQARTGRPFDTSKLFTRHLLESFLDRLTKTEHSSDFVLKGGILLAAYVVCRTAGQITGGWLVRRTLVPGLPREVGLHLTSPGVVAIALALDARGSAAAEAAGLLLPVVVFGTLASEILSWLFAPAEAAPPGGRTR